MEKVVGEEWHCMLECVREESLEMENFRNLMYKIGKNMKINEKIENEL